MRSKRPCATHNFPVATLKKPPHTRYRRCPAISTATLTFRALFIPFSQTNMDSGGYAKRSINENEVYNGGGHGLAFIFWLLEANAPKALVVGSVAAVITWAASG